MAPTERVGAAVAKPPFKTTVTALRLACLDGGVESALIRGAVPRMCNSVCRRYAGGTDSDDRIFAPVRGNFSHPYIGPGSIPTSAADSEYVQRLIYRHGPGSGIPDPDQYGGYDRGHGLYAVGSYGTPNG